jgi:hypothetical protein
MAARKMSFRSFQGKIIKKAEMILSSGKRHTISLLQLSSDSIKFTKLIGWTTSVGLNR